MRLSAGPRVTHCRCCASRVDDGIARVSCRSSIAGIKAETFVVETVVLGDLGVLHQV